MAELLWHLNIPVDCRRLWSDARLSYDWSSLIHYKFKLFDKPLIRSLVDNKTINILMSVDECAKTSQHRVYGYKS